MPQQINRIDKNDYVTDIVTRDYRTAMVFRKYGIDYCCGGKFPLEKACFMRDLNLQKVIEDLETAVQPIPVYSTARYKEWNLDFLMDYIIYIHHEYLRTMIPLLTTTILEFVENHQRRYSYLGELQVVFKRLADEMLPHLSHEENVIFPYIRQMEYAYNNKEAYAGLLVRTLSKPVEEVMKSNQEATTKYLGRLRELTGNYTPPLNACTNHKVSFSLLREFDYDLSQHLHLENDILFPRAIAMESELLLQKN